MVVYFKYHQYLGLRNNIYTFFSLGNMGFSADKCVVARSVQRRWGGTARARDTGVGDLQIGVLRGEN